VCWFDAKAARHFNGDQAVELGIARFVHLTHPACADWRQDIIRAEASASRQRHDNRRFYNSAKSEERLTG
jgi:hypothetical protein